jgi:hypothetical protein
MTSLGSILLGDPSVAAGHLLRQLSAAGLDLARGVTVGGLSVPAVEIVNPVLQLLELPVGNLALQGWHNYHQVSTAKARTAGGPGAREVVRLLEHTISSSLSPTVDVSVGAASVTVLSLEIEVEIRVSTVNLVVEGGNVVWVAPGNATATVTLSASGVTVAKRVSSR